MSLASESLRKAVIQRAGERCEYCLLTSRFQVGGFELDHVHPVSRGGPTTLENLAFACPVCNGSKLNHVDGPDLTTGEVVPLFHPRTQNWHDHFQWSMDSPFEIVGQTSCGRATIQRLALNDPEMVVCERSTPNSDSTAPRQALDDVGAQYLLTGQHV